MSDIEATIDKLSEINDTIESDETAPPQGSEKPSVEDIVPDKEELITMSAAELGKLKDNIMAETAKMLMGDVDFRDKLRISLERDSAIRTVNAKGQFADPGLKVNQSRPLGPIDHQEAVIAPFKTDESMKYRMINNRDETLRAIRHYQGWIPVRDLEGNEVRYMDGILAKMPKEKHAETIGAVVEENKRLRGHGRDTTKERFEEAAAKEGFETFGDGLKLDKQ